ncbi:1,3-propanediol dehydrogenase [Spirochaetia bacterium]|nr:1,3-propanediol dehydrogenase [Spirochaetia bacterium]
MTDIIFKLDPEIIIGTGTINRVGTISGAGNRVLIITEQGLRGSPDITRLTAILDDSGAEGIVFDDIPVQATAEAAEAAAELARGACCSAIIGFGGLKTQAIARTTAIIANSKLGIYDFLDGKKPQGTVIPYIAVPTTSRDPFLFSGQFVLTDPRDRLVKQVTSPSGICITAIIDSSITESQSGTPAAAFDGFCIAVEAYCSNKAHFMSDALLEQALTLYANIMDAQVNNQTEDLSKDLMERSAHAGFLASLGAAVSTPGIGTALAYSLSSRFTVEKAACSTVLLPPILDRLVTARPEKMARVATLIDETVTGDPVAESAQKAPEAIRRRMEQLQVPSHLNDFNLSLDRLVPAAEAARNLEFVAHSPWTVAVEDAYDLLKQAF